MTVEPADGNERFRERFAASGSEAVLAVEAEAVGSDYRANGYTTIAQADELGRVLGLGPGQVLLDAGAGCGWPGLYLAGRHGCRLVSADPVAEGVGVARQRAVTDGLNDRSLALCAAAEALPLRYGSVDAVVHTDLLC